MHLGVVHDDGPDQMAANVKRIGIIYLFAHDPGDPINCAVGFENGDLGVKNRVYRKGDLVELKDPQAVPVNGVVIVKGRISGKGPNKPIVEAGLYNYYIWAKTKNNDIIRELLERGYQYRVP